MRRHNGLVLLTLLACCATARSDPLHESAIAPTGLSAAQARQVLRIVLRHEHFPLGKAGFHIETLASRLRSHWQFSVTFESPQAAATTMLGAFAVSRMTGDVWETNRCRRYDFAQLRQWQARIMARTGGSFASEADDRRQLGCGRTDIDP